MFFAISSVRIASFEEKEIRMSACATTSDPFFERMGYVANTGFEQL